MVEKKKRNRGGETPKKTHFLKRKSQEMSASSATKAWVHVIRVLDATHLAFNNTAGQKTPTNYVPTQRQNEPSR